MTPRATVSVILPTCNRSAVLRTSLERLLAQDYPPAQLEILVADSSSDDTPEMVAEVGRSSPVRVRLLSSDERLPAVKRNQALRAAGGDLAIFLSDDVWVGPDFVSNHVAAHAQFVDPVAILGHVEQSRQRRPLPIIACDRPFAYHEIADRAGQPVPWQYHWSMNVSMPRKVMLDRNLIFHEAWGEIGHEDVELGYRWSRAGYQTVYVPAARGEHYYHPQDLASSRRRQVSVGRGLRDLEVLVPEPGLHKCYGVVTPAAPWRDRLGKTARQVLLNSVTAPPLELALQGLPRHNRLAEWCYGKLMLRHTQIGYDRTPPRHPVGTRTKTAHTRAA